jgi:hypothetical protein
MNTLELIERKLGRRLLPADRGRISNLNEVPAVMVEQARALGSVLLAESLLAYITSTECHPFLKRYVQDVIFGKASPQTWRRGRILVPSLSLEEQLCRETTEILAPIGREFRVRIIPRLEAWQAGVSWVGAPAKPDPNADYRSPVPDGAASLGTAGTEPVAEPYVALRRWIAGRLASELHASGRIGSVTDISELAAGLPPPDRWSRDALIAARALLREFRELVPSEAEIPGFRGPDIWYHGEP